MTTEVSLLAAFIMGLSGGVHCLVMCGGIGSALAMAAKSPVYLGLYQAGRITSYTLVALFFALILDVVTPKSHTGMLVMQGVSALLLLGIGLHISMNLNALRFVEAGGAVFWRQIKGLSQALFPVDSAAKAFSFGLLWGWLPCGLVYSALAWSLSQESVLLAAACMASFGLGTLPWLLASSALAKSLAASPWLRPVLGFVLIGLALWSFISLAAPLFTTEIGAQSGEHLHHH